MIIILTGLASAAGCRSKPQAAAAVAHEKPLMTSSWQSTPVPAMAEPTAVRQGAAPLVYLVEGGATIRVRDQTGNRDLARAYVPGRSIVRVDARNGVIYGDETVFPGPLPEGARYLIFVDPSGENVARQGTFQPHAREAR